MQSIAAITSELPWPLNSGGRLRTYYLLRALAREFRVHLVAGVSANQKDDWQRFQQDGIEVHPVLLPPRKPWREGLRAAAAAFHSEPYVLYHRHNWPAMRKAVRKLARQQPPDAWYLDHLDSFVFHDLLSPGPVVLDLHNVYSTLTDRTAADAGLILRPYLRREAHLLSNMERRAAASADAVFAVSENDRQYFARMTRRAVHVIPNGVDCARYASLPAGRDGDRPSILYIGVMSWQPNVDAAEFLVRLVLPQVRARIPGVRVRIVGRDPTREVRKLGQLPSVEICEGAADMVQELQGAHVLAVPLASGGGTRMKILEAFAAGLPVVSTPVGCEGLAVEHGRHLLVAPGERLAESVVQVLEDRRLATQLAEQARTLVEKQYDWSGIGTVANQTLSQLIRDWRRRGPDIYSAGKPRRPIRVLELRSVRGTGGGPEKTILLGAAKSDPARIAVTVCYLRDARDPLFDLDKRAKCHGVDYVEIVERTSFDPAVWSELRWLVRQRRIDIIHSHDYKTDLLALLLAKAQGIIPLATAHGWTGKSSRERMYYRADKMALSRFPRVIAVSQEIAAELVRSGLRPARIEVLLNGIDAKAYRREADRKSIVRQQLGVPLDAIVIGAVGRLEPEKRFDLLIRAFATLRQAHTRLRLVVVGEGSLRPALEELAEQLQVDAVQLPGYRADAADLHHAFDVYVQSSDYEGTSNAVLEAMAMETPVVATAVGGTAELIHSGVHGLLVPPGSAESIAQAVEDTLADPSGARRRTGAARARVENELSFEARMRRVEAIYEGLVRQHPTSKTTERL